MSKNLVETLVGLLVILIAGGFLYSAYKTTDIGVGANSGYKIFAKFDRADGLNMGSDVKVGGIKVGKVIGQKLDESNYQAIIEMVITDGVKLPVDSTAEIIGNGLLGEKYIAVLPGADEEKIAAGGSIEFTQSAISLESLIGKFVFSSAEKEGKESKDNK
jgi:phospholipid/cholesterol/gamma-HCH transport system substrate-binding protein